VSAQTDALGFEIHQWLIHVRTNTLARARSVALAIRIEISLARARADPRVGVMSQPAIKRSGAFNTAVLDADRIR